jgi:hypothetical protein
MNPERRIAEFARAKAGARLLSLDMSTGIVRPRDGLQETFNLCTFHIIFSLSVAEC